MDILQQLGIKNLNSGAFSGQSWCMEQSKKHISVYSPSSGKKLAEVLSAGMDDYQQLIKRAKAAFLAWRLVPAPKRGEIIRQVGQILREHKDLLGSLITLEMGKSKQEGDGEVQEMIDMADFAVGQSRMLYGKTMHSERKEHRMYEQWHPYGVVGIISAFNFPVAVWAWNAFIAAICGNVTLWKPSTKTPLTAIAVQLLCAHVLKKNACPDIFSLMITADHAVVDTMVQDKDLPLLSFTGSTPVGREIGTKVAARLGKSILELGGNNAIIVDATADLTLAIPAIVFGAIGTAGQRCTTTRRLFVHQSLYDAVLKQLIAAYHQIKIGDPMDPKNHLGPLIDKAAIAQYEKTITALKEAGAEVVYGGKVLKRSGFFVEPALVTGAHNHWDLVQKETFVPILYILPFQELTDVIALHNAVPQGLASALFTRNLQSAELFLSARGSDCGIANINIGTSGAEIGGAFGGEKETGGGREAGSDAWKAYMRRQTTTINWGNALPLAQGIEFALTR